MKPSVEEVERELRRLPREAASEGFTQRVLREALESEPESSKGRWARLGLLAPKGFVRPPSVPGWILGLASVALAAMLGLAYSELRERLTEAGQPAGEEHLAAVAAGADLLPEAALGRPDSGEPVRLHDFVESRRRATLESEYLALQAELERLRRLQAVRDSVIVVPGAGEFDYYIDLRPVLTAQASGYQPASMPPSNRRH